MCDTPPGGAWTLTDVWDGSSELPWPTIISLPFLAGGGFDCSVPSLKSDDFCRASWWGFTTWGFLGSGSNGFDTGTGWLDSPKTLDACRLCWLSLRCAGVVPCAGASEPKTLDLFRAAWQRFTSFFGAAGSGAASFPNKLIEVLPPGGANTLFWNESDCYWLWYYVRCTYMFLYYVLLYSWPHEWARWGKPCVVIGYLGRRDGPILVIWDYPQLSCKFVVVPAW